MSKLTENLDQLLDSYSFDQLSVEQQEVALSQITREEYTLMREVILSSKQLKAPAIPPLDKDLHQQLKQAYRKQHGFKGKTTAQRWSALALGVLLGALTTAGYHWLRTDPQPERVEEAAPVVMTDTIYVQKTDTLYVTVESEPKVITKEIIKYIDRETEVLTVPITPDQPLPLAYQSEPIINKQLQDTLQGNYFNNIDLADIIPMKVGKSVGEETELMDLLREMPSDGLDNE